MRLLFLLFFSFSAFSSPLLSHHWYGGLPVKSHPKNPILMHGIFTISYNLDRNLPTWVAYSLYPGLVSGNIQASRKYKADPLLENPVQFKNWNKASTCDGTVGRGKGYDKGHFAPVGSFKNSSLIYRAQYLSNITPQRPNLNQGVWNKLEQAIRSFVRKGNTVKILTGPFYEEEGEKLPPCWKAAQGVFEEIPSAYWKIIVHQNKTKADCSFYKKKVHKKSCEEKIKAQTCGFFMSQDIKSRRDSIKKYEISYEDLEERLGFSLFDESIREKIKKDCSFLF